MPSDIFKLLVAVLTILLAGSVIFRIIVTEPGDYLRLERIAYCWPLGLTAIALSSFLLSLADVNVNGWLAVTLIGGLWLLQNNYLGWATFWTDDYYPGFVPVKLRLTDFEKLLLGIIIGCLTARAVACCLAPLSDWDSLGNWGFKAKLLTYGTLQTNYAYWHEGQYQNINAKYPLLVPLMYSYVCRILGRYDDQLMCVLNPVNLAAFIALLFCTIRRFATRQTALTVAAIAASLPATMHYTECGQGDVPLMVIGGGAVFCLFAWLRGACTSRLWLCAVLCGGAMFTKLEGQVLFLGIAIVVFAWPVLDVTAPLGRCEFWKATGLALLIALPYLIWARTIPYPHYQLPLTIFTSRWKETPTLLWSVAQNGLHFHNQVGLPKWNLLWILVPVGLLATKGWRKSPWCWFLFLAAWHAVCMSLLMLLTSPNALNFQTQEIGWERYTIGTLPALWLVLAKCLEDARE